MTHRGPFQPLPFCDSVIQEGRFSLYFRKKFFIVKDVKHWNVFAQRGDRCPIPGKIQGQIGWCSEQPDLVEGGPALCNGVWTR